MKKTVLSLSVMAALTASQAGALTTIKIATISPLSGANSNLGIQIKNSVQLAVNDMKADFAKAGMTVSLVGYDDQGDAATGTSAARRVVADKGILGVIGTLQSGVAIPVSAVLQPSHIAMISPSNTAAKVTDRGLSNMNRVCARDDAEGPAGGEFVVNQLKAKSVYVLNDKTPFGQGMADEAEKVMRARGLNIVQSEGIDSAERDFTAIITKIQTLKPDVIYFGGIYGQAGPLAKQLRDKGVNIPLVGGDGFDSDDMLTLAGSGANNIYFTTVAPPVDVVTAAKTVNASYRKAFGDDIQGFGVLSYDSAKVLLQGILNAYKAAGNKVPTRTQVETSVRSGTFKNLVTGEVKFDKNGDRQTAKMYVIAVKNGKRSTAGTVNVIRK